MLRQRTLGGLALGVALLLICGISNAFALSFTINQGNTPNIGSGPFATVNVSVNAVTHDATITFTAFNPPYRMGDGSSVALNLNGSATQVGGFSWTGGNANTSFSLNGSGTVDGFGNFNFRVNNFDGFNSAVTSLTFTLHNAAWSADTDVLTANESGHLAASHIFVEGTDCGGSPCTGFATDGPTPTPEPSTLLLIGSSLVAVGVWGRKKVHA